MLFDTRGVELPDRGWAAGIGGLQAEEKRKNLRFCSLGWLVGLGSGLWSVGWRLKALAVEGVLPSAPVRRDRDRVARLGDPSCDGL